MADSPAQVIEFLRDLARRARPGAERDLAELREFARDELALADREIDSGQNLQRRRAVELLAKPLDGEYRP